MFTGIVQSTGEVLANEPHGDFRRLRLKARLSGQDRVLGASVAVAGVCLTVAGSTAEELLFDLGPETLAATTLAAASPGTLVNLEPALRLGEALGGHLVSGHVDAVGSIERRDDRGETVSLEVCSPPSLRHLLAPKGSVTVDGVSLTVQRLTPTGFAVGLVPHTLSATTLHQLQPTDQVNLEVDLLARYVAQLLAARGLDPSPPGPSAT